MSRKRREFPIWLALAAPLLLAAALSMVFLGGKDKKAAQDSSLDAGLGYLEVREKQDPAQVMAVRKQIYDAKIAAQREQLVNQLTSGGMDPFSMFKDYCIMGDSRAVGFWYHGYLDKSRCIADGGHTIRDITANMDALVAMNPGTVYLCYGLNDTSIGYWDTAEQYVSEYMQTIQEI